MFRDEEEEEEEEKPAKETEKEQSVGKEEWESHVLGSEGKV